MSAEPIKLKSLPDPAKIIPMADPRLTCVKRQKGVGNNKMIRNGVKVEKVDDVFKMMDEVARTDGPGAFEFTVADMEGGEQDKWAVIFGNQVDEGMVSDVMNPGTQAPSNGTAFGATPGQPMQIGNGFWLTLFPHDPTKGILTTPQRTMMEWSQGMPLPGLGGFGAAPASPVGSMGISMTPAPGESAVMDMLRSEREQRREQDLRTEFRLAQEAQAKRYEDLLEKLSAKPAGPSPEMEMLKAQLATTERRLEDEKREAAARHRDDTLRAEITATNNRLENMMREATSHKPDPIAPLSALLTQIMSTNQQGTTALMSAMDKATSVQAHASQESTRALADRIMPPEKIMELLTLAKDKGPEQSIMLEGMRSMWGMMQDIVKLQREAGDQGEPAWVGMIQRGIDQIGGLGQAYLTRQQQQPQYQPPRRPVAVSSPVRDAAVAPPGQQFRAAEPATPVTPAKPIDPNDPNALREAAAARVYPIVKPISVEPDAVIPAGITAAEVSAAYTEMAQATPDAVRGLVQDTPDGVFFGSVFPSIGPLRMAVAADQLDANDVANAILGAQADLHKKNEFPQAMELLKVRQFEVLVERLLPEEDDEFIEEVVEALQKRLPG